MLHCTKVRGIRYGLLISNSIWRTFWNKLLIRYKMGGCCCCSSRSEAVRAPVDIYRQQNLEEHEPLSSAFDGSSPASGIVAVDTNLDTSTPDTYRAPPAPLPYDVVLAVPENPVLEKSDVKSQINDQQESKDDQESLKADESCKKGVLEEKPDEEDVCPICLEEYDEENPRSVTKCEHHFHLCCILEWMERSDTCPVCDQITLVDEMFE